MTEEAKASTNDQTPEPAAQQPSGASQPDPNAQNQGTPAPQAPAKEEKWEFNGNFEELKEKNPELLKYANGIRRYLTTKEQDHAAKVKTAQEYEQVKASPIWNQFLQYYQNPQAQQTTSTAEESYVDPDTQKYVEGKEKQYVDQINSLKKEVGQIRSEAEVTQFASLHPQFWEYDELGLIRPLLREGKSLTEAFTQAEGVVQKLKKGQIQANNDLVQKKMNASGSAGPSVSNDSEIVWVDTQSQVLGAATELAMKGVTNKKVRVRRK
jgi:hypothetical protein